MPMGWKTKNRGKLKDARQYTLLREIAILKSSVPSWFLQRPGIAAVLDPVRAFLPGFKAM